MNPDIDKISSRRERLGPDELPMAWLYAHVNTALADRMATMQDTPGKALYIGFNGSAGEQFQTFSQRVSLLDNSAAGIGGLHKLQQDWDTCVLSLQLAWLDYEVVIPVLRKLLVPGGRLYFVTFGPDTLAELREAWARVDDQPHVHPFIDLHHLGDCLQRSGFQKPILDVDWLGVEYEDIDLLMDELRREGMHNLWPERRKSLTGNSRLAALKQEFNRQQPVQVTVELIYGYGEVPLETGGGIRVTAPRFEPPNSSGTGSE